MKKIFITISSAILCLAANAAEPGSTSFNYIALPSTTASLSRGGVCLSDALPTELLEGKSFDSGVSYLMWSPSYVNEKFVDASASFKVGSSLAFGADFTYGINENYDIYGESGIPNGSFAPTDIRIGVSGAYMISPSLALTAGVKILNSKLSEQSKLSSTAFDLMAVWKKNGILVGGGLRNVGGKVKSLGGSEYSIPSSFMAGGRYSMAFGNQLNLDVEADLDYYFCGAAAVAAGLQFDWKDSIFLRGGYHYGAEGAPVPSYAAVGAGIKFFNIAVDFSYLLASDILGNSFRAGVRYCF